MNSTGIIKQRLQDSITVKQALLEDERLLQQIEMLSEQCLKCLRNESKIIFAGNGGSFADAQHLSAEFTSRFMFDRAPLASIALGTNNSAISAIGNDYGFEEVFSRELKGIARAGDIVVALTTSGNSTNIIELVRQAGTLGLYTSVWTGVSGGEVAKFCKTLKVPSNVTARIQECHITIGHIICEIVEADYFG